MATDLIPNSLQARKTLTAISPLLATKTLRMGLYSILVEYPLFWDHLMLLLDLRKPLVVTKRTSILPYEVFQFFFIKVLLCLGGLLQKKRILGLMYRRRVTIGESYQNCKQGDSGTNSICNLCNTTPMTVQVYKQKRVS